METGAMFVRLINGNDVKYVNIQHIQTIERLYFEPEGSMYENGRVLWFGKVGDNAGEHDYLKITLKQFEQLVDFLPIANRA